jgi:hypothetical protein
MMDRLGITGTIFLVRARERLQFVPADSHIFYLENLFSAR